MIFVSSTNITANNYSCILFKSCPAQHRQSNKRNDKMGQLIMAGTGSEENQLNPGIGTTGPAGSFHVKISAQFSATGGTITTSGAYTVHTFTSSGTFTPNGAETVEYLVVAGGGAGGGGGNGTQES